MILEGEAQVTGNIAGVVGGGILPDNASVNKVFACSSWTGAISPNTPDDPPPLHARVVSRAPGLPVVS